MGGEVKRDEDHTMRFKNVNVAGQLGLKFWFGLVLPTHIRVLVETH